MARPVDRRALQVRLRKRKRVAWRRSQKMQVPTRPNQRWSMDFVHDVRGKLTSNLTATVCARGPAA